MTSQLLDTCNILLAAHRFLVALPVYTCGPTAFLSPAFLSPDALPLQGMDTVVVSALMPGGQPAPLGKAAEERAFWFVMRS